MHLQPLGAGLDANGVEFAVRRAPGRGVGQRILVAQFVSDGGKGRGQIVNQIGEEGAAAAVVGELLERLVAFGLFEYLRLAALGRWSPGR